MIIGITGKSGSGKSYVSEVLAKQLGFLHVDIDKISHETLSSPNCQRFLKSTFGNEVFANNQVDRKKLGKIVFNDKSLLEALNSFCQKEIETRLDQIISQTKSDIILDYALLPKLRQFSACDKKILLGCDFETRYNRVKARENISLDYFKIRDDSLGEIYDTKFDLQIENLTEKDLKTIINFIENARNL